MSRTIRSPDGRTWTLERARPESVVSAAKKEPVFWGSIILTALMIGFIVWITIRFGVGTYFILTVVVLVIWLIERGFSSARPNLTGAHGRTTGADLHLADDASLRVEPDGGQDRRADPERAAGRRASRNRSRRRLAGPLGQFVSTTYVCRAINPAMRRRSSQPGRTRPAVRLRAREFARERESRRARHEDARTG